MVARVYFRSNVSDRYAALREVLTRWAEEGQTVLIKPNRASAERALGEASSENTLRAFRNFGYLPWADRFGAEVLDLNRDAFEVALLARELVPHLSVLDGFVGMEGEVVGDPLGFAVRHYRPHPAHAEQRRWELAGTPLDGKI